MSETLEQGAGATGVDTTATAGVDTTGSPGSETDRSGESQAGGGSTADPGQGAPGFGDILTEMGKGTGEPGGGWDARGAIEELRAEIAEFRDFRERVLKETGQIGAVQRSLQEQATRQQNFEHQLGSLYDGIAGSELLPSETRAALAAVRQFQQQMQPPPQQQQVQTQQDPSGGDAAGGGGQQTQEAVQAEIRSANERIYDYARRRGVDLSGVTQAQWTEISRQGGGSVRGAEKVALDMIDRYAEGAANRQRVETETKSAPGTPSPAGTGMTLEQFKAMDPEKQAELSDEEFARLDELLMKEVGAAA